MEHLYTKKQAAQLRQKIIEQAILPVVKKCFEKYPQIRSATLLVAQYWDDEATDAVHEHFVFSVLDTPDLEAAYKTEENYTEDNINLPGLGKYCYLVGDAREELDEEGCHDYYWPNNWDAIPAFAAFCREGASQLMSTAEAYTPYAVFRRCGDDIEIEVVGQMLRPWLDGIQPESE